MAVAADAQTNELRSLQELALERNPRLKAMAAEARMMRSRIPQSRALEDPRLKLGVNNISAKTFGTPRDRATSTSVGTAQTSYGTGTEDMPSAIELGVSQMIPLGKFGPRHTVAVKEHERANLLLKVERVEMLHMLRMNYYLLTYVRSAIRIQEDLKRQLRLVIDSETAAAKSGMGTIGNVVKATIEYTMIEEELINLRQQERETLQKIYAVLGDEPPLKGIGAAEPRFHDIDPAAVRRAIAEANPQLKRFMVETEISKGTLARTQAEYIPDLELGFSYMRTKEGARRVMGEYMADMGGLSYLKKTDRMKRDDMLSFMMTVNVPFWFWTKNVPMVDEMKQKHEAAKNTYQDELNKLNARAEILLGQLKRWRELHQLYRGTLIPQTELALEMNLARYRTSAVEFMSVIDSVRMLLRYRKEQQMAIAEYRAAYSELSALMGLEVLP